jgi:hypothetical protein
MKANLFYLWPHLCECSELKPIQKGEQQMKNNKHVTSNFADLISLGFQSGRLRRTSRALIFAATTLAMGAQGCASHESTSEKIENSARSAKTNAKEDARDLKKKARDATGNSSTTEDLKDKAKNAKDEASDKAQELKDKVD